MRLLPVLPLVALALAAGGCSLTKPEEQPAYIKATAVEARVDRIEHQNEALLELQRQLEALQADVRRLRGEVEDAQHEASASREQQRNLYGDLDRRLTALDARIGAAAAPVAPVAPGAAATAAGSDKDAYQAALERLKGKDYPGAEKALNDFIGAYPQSPLVENAQYWLGETYYVEKRYDDAVSAFQLVILDHPDSRKVPDAMLKIGYSQYELKRFHEAREVLARVTHKFPDSSAATEAGERLKRMDAEHH
jgi:tol-pal system protein YbgF